MRYSGQSRLEVAEYKDRKWDSASLLIARVVRETSAEDRRGGILLVGGTGARDLAIRRAQAPLRFDREPSRWSHAALILSWPEQAGLNDIVGAEVALDPADPHLQVPERNGVTLFRAGRYADRTRYPNVAFACLCGKGSSKLKDAIVSAALNPSQDRLRFPMWDWLGEWASAAYGVVGEENPISRGIPMPAAAFCEYAYEAARIDLTPGAAAPNVCPEALWASLLYWHESMTVDECAMKMWSLAPSAADRESLGVSLKGEMPRPKPKRKAKAKKKKKGRARRKPAGGTKR